MLRHTGPHIWVSLFFKILRLDSRNSYSPTWCRSSPRVHEPSSLHWSYCTSSYGWSIECMLLSSSASLPKLVHLVWSSIFELHRKPEIFVHEHVPHLRLPYWVVGASELEHAAEWVFHLLSCLKSSTSLWYQSKRNGRRPQPSFNPLRMLKDVDVSLGSKFCLFQNFNDSLHYHVCVYKFINGYIFLNIEWIWLCVTCVCVLKLKCRCENVCSLWCM